MNLEGQENKPVEDIQPNMFSQETVKQNTEDSEDGLCPNCLGTGFKVKYTTEEGGYAIEGLILSDGIIQKCGYHDLGITNV
jgi:hypothetical protein